MRDSGLTCWRIDIDWVNQALVINNEFKKLNSEHDIEVFKNNLLIYKDLIGSCEDYFTFTNYHHNMIDKINTDYNLIITKSLIQHKPNKLLEFFKKFFKYDKNL